MLRNPACIQADADGRDVPFPGADRCHKGLPGLTQLARSPACMKGKQVCITMKASLCCLPKSDRKTKRADFQSAMPRLALSGTPHMRPGADQARHYEAFLTPYRSISPLHPHSHQLATQLSSAAIGGMSPPP